MLHTILNYLAIVAASTLGTMLFFALVYVLVWFGHRK